MQTIKYNLLVVILLTIIFTSCFHSEQNKKVGNTLVKAIEEYRKTNDSLPNSLQEVGQNEIIDDVLFCYEKVDSINYMVWFGTTLGEGIYYYSDTKKWEDKLRKMGKGQESLLIFKDNNDEKEQYIKCHLSDYGYKLHLPTEYPKQNGNEVLPNNKVMDYFMQDSLLQIERNNHIKKLPFISIYARSRSRWKKSITI